MVIIPLVTGKAYTEHCNECDRDSDFWLEKAIADFKDKKTITFYFYCIRCHEKNPLSGWKRVVVADVKL